MRTLARDHLLAHPQLLTSDQVRCDYVYSYPPRQAYRPLPDKIEPPTILKTSVAADNRANIYVHFPFCRQSCSFCNLYTVPSTDVSMHSTYVELLETEIHLRAQALGKIDVRTLYFGGGTPSMVQPALLNRVLVALERYLDFRLSDVSEVAIEVSPDTATLENLAALHEIGFNRINVGVQGTASHEISSIGRRYSPDTNLEALRAAMGVGFSNVCVDLIYGLPSQSDSDWLSSLQFVAASRPETICAYPLTIRAGTRFGRAMDESDPVNQYRLYDLAHATLSEFGYTQETHVRWSLPGGGYLQKSNHWAGENLIGLGAGARSYVREADVRNGYSLRPRRAALVEYARRIADAIDPVTDGFVMDPEERMRKSVILGLMHLNTRNFARTHGHDPRDIFPQEFSVLEAEGLLAHRGDVLRLTEAGVRHRDVIVQLFFSQRVSRLVAEYEYVG